MSALPEQAVNAVTIINKTLRYAIFFKVLILSYGKKYQKSVLVTIRYDFIANSLKKPLVFAVRFLSRVVVVSRKAQSIPSSSALRDKNRPRKP